jgi:signal transduction histidine kinase
MNGATALSISVADTGQGFPDGFLDRAFLPFTRADAGRSRQHGGAGLGLAIVKGVVDAHGGIVEAANRPEGGAIVTVRLPA